MALVRLNALLRGLSCHMLRSTASKNITLTVIFTFPGITVPTEGEMVTGAPSGTTNSKDVGPTGAISPKCRLC